MRSTRNKPRRQGGLSLDMAPMIDVVFLLLIFFAVVTRFASAERVELDDTWLFSARVPMPQHRKKKD